MIVLGDYGTTYYIILQGRVDVYVPIESTKDWDLADLFVHVIKNYDNIIMNKQSKEVLLELGIYFPDVFANGELKAK